MSLPQLLDMVFTELACKADASSDSPRTLAEAMKRPDREHWWAAAMEEVDALEQNGTFTVRERTPQDRPIGSRWVLRVKRNADGSIERYKGRVVAKGYSQRPGFDFAETFAPTAKWAALRAILAIVC